MAMISPKGEKEVSMKGETNLGDTEGQQETTLETTQGGGNFSIINQKRDKKARTYLEPSLDISPQIFPFVL